MKVVFIAGPLSGISNGQEFEQGIQEQYVRVAVEAGIQLLQAGYAPFIPHLSWYIDPYTKYHEWYEADLEFVRRCDLVLRLPGLSNGADREVALADELGIPVYHSLAEMFYVDDMTKALTQIDQPEPTPISPKAFCTECGAEENPAGRLMHKNGCFNASHIMPVGEYHKTRVFDSGATRDTDEGKLDYEGFISPLVVRRFAEYMHTHRVQRDGSLRASDNWTKGIPRKVYMKSLWRHFHKLWSIHRGTESADQLEDTLAACLFNIMGFMYEVLLKRDVVE